MISVNDNKWQMALFKTIIYQYDSAVDAIIFIRQLYKPDELFYFDDGIKKYAIESGLITSDLIKEMFLINGKAMVDHERNQDVIKQNIAEQKTKRENIKQFCNTYFGDLK